MMKETMTLMRRVAIIYTAIMCLVLYYYGAPDSVYDYWLNESIMFIIFSYAIELFEKIMEK